MNEESKQEYATLIAKKSERLVTALYLVTDLMNDSEPIKHSIRKNAVTLLSSMNSLAQLDVKDRITEFKMSLRSVTEIVSLLHVSVQSGIVSDMNGELLMNGFRSLQSILEKKQPVLTKEMFALDDAKLLGHEGGENLLASTSYDVLTPLALSRLHNNKEDLRRSEESLKRAQLLSKMNIKDSKGQGTEESLRDKDYSNKIVFNKNNGAATSAGVEQKVRFVPTVTSSFQIRKNGRREQILALFVKGVDVSIKDIASRIRGCSEKTIQRELNSLLSDNLIERIGEKRWSRYILI